MPAIQHSLGLHRLAAKNPEGGDDDGDSERGWRGILHMAEVSRRSLGCKAHAAHQQRRPEIGSRRWRTGWRCLRSRLTVLRYARQFADDVSVTPSWGHERIVEMPQYFRAVITPNCTVFHLH